MQLVVCIHLGDQEELALADLGCECTWFSYDSDLERRDHIFTWGAQGCDCFVQDYTEILLLAAVPVLLCLVTDYVIPPAQVVCAVRAR